ncbi:MAG: nickel-dependent hydrogenase large subunit, partial [Proteobacteria bacterium]|nr:nickel-dependent hydrogenase large subunit [Pseudomonadota bacterium]
MAALDIGVDWDGGAIRHLTLASARPQTSRLLAGLEPAGVVALLGQLYAVCGRAQRACAELALAA